VTHLFNFLGVAYYDQSQFVLLALFALVPVLSLSMAKTRDSVELDRPTPTVGELIEVS